MRTLLLAIALPLAGQSVDSSASCEVLGDSRCHGVHMEQANGLAAGENRPIGTLMEDSAEVKSLGEKTGTDAAKARDALTRTPRVLLRKREATGQVADRRGSRSLFISQLSLAGAAVLDVRSSWDRRELNPFLGRGTFGARQAAVSLGITGGLILVEALVVRKYPAAAVAFRWANFVGAGAHGVAAAHNWGTR